MRFQSPFSKVRTSTFSCSTERICACGKWRRTAAGVHLDGEILFQIETGFDLERAVQLDAFGAARPGVHHLVLDLDPALHDRELGDRGRLLEINPVVNGDARLKVRQPNERFARIASHFFQRRPIVREGKVSQR